MTRQELYELVWAEPMRKLAERFNISDRGLAKICARTAIPVPDRGYWARRQAGQEWVKTPLPPPTCDTPHRITIRPSTSRLLDHLLSMPAGTDEPIEADRLEVEHECGEKGLECGSNANLYATEADQKKEELLIEKLLQQARDHRTASEIREFVSHVATSERATLQPADFAAWRDWALKQADRLDATGNERLFDRTVSDTELWSQGNG